jgi:hypothetical protein
MLLAPPLIDNAIDPCLFDLWPKWKAAIATLTERDFELTVEEFAALLSLFKTLTAAGVDFEVETIALMRCLELQAAETVDGFEDDTDNDAEAE